MAQVEPPVLAPEAAPAEAAPAAVPLARVAVGLALLTFAIFLPALRLDWVDFDDNYFVTKNPQVASGLTWEGIYWAFTKAEIDYWRPLSWLSHMVDIELFGPAAAGHHLTNLLIHIAGTVMLLLALHRLTGALWPSAMVAALFAWHPLHVESVAWIAERKDVLCGFFWFYTLWAYAGYVREPTPRNYLRVFFGFVLGAMSKPMIVTLPCVLLLLDWWPLRRLEFPFKQRPPVETLGQIGRLLLEKIPLFVVVLLLSLSTMQSQHRVGTMSTLDSLPLAARLPNTLAAYGTYLWQTLWPADLCVLYPLQPVPAGRVIASTALLALVTAAAIRLVPTRPFVLMGWLWFLGTLVPAIGLVQVGDQAHADRYTYVPLIGLFILGTWTATRWITTVRHPRRWAVTSAVVVLAACVLVTRQQLEHWENGFTLFQRAVRVTRDNLMAHYTVGVHLRAAGQPREAVAHLERAIRVTPLQGALLELAWCHVDLGEYPSAYQVFSRAVGKEPRSKLARDAATFLRAEINQHPDVAILPLLLAVSLSAAGNHEAAVPHLDRVIQLDPQNLDARMERAGCLAALRRETEALASLQEIVRLAPDHPAARARLGAALTGAGQLAEAAREFQAAVRLAPDNPETRYNLAVLLNLTGRSHDSRVELDEILRQTQNRHLPALQQLAWLLATHPELRDGPQAQRLAQEVIQMSQKRTAIRLDVLAAATAAAGDFAGASALASEALELALREGRGPLADALRSRLALYQARKPFTAPPPAKAQP